MPEQFTSWVLTAIVSLGLLGGIGLGVKTVIERNLLKAKAHLDNANADSIIAEAAKELVDPLRRELASERAEHRKTIQTAARDRERFEIRVRVAERQAGEAKQEAAGAQSEAARLSLDLQEEQAEVARLRHEIIRLKEALGWPDPDSIPDLA